MRRSRRLVAAGLLVLVLLLVFGVWRATHRVPRYAGRTLYEWIAELQSTDPLAKPLPADVLSRRENAEAAIRAIGTNALPFLMADLQADYGLKETIHVWISRLPFLNVQVPSTVQDRWARGIIGMEVLGPIAKPWLPELATMATNNIDTGPRALVAVGPDALPAITNLLNSPASPAKLHLIIALIDAVSEDRIKPETASVAVPILLENLRSTNYWTWVGTAPALGAIHQKPELCVPGPVAALSVSGPGMDELRRECIAALGQFGRHATNAVPLLEKACSEPEQSVRDAASTALHQIKQDLRSK